MGLFSFSKNKETKIEEYYSTKNSEKDNSAKQGTSLVEEKKDMIKGIEDLSETSVKEVMIPRIDVDFISVDISEEELLSFIAKSGHSRFPVYRESIDKILGILYVKDIIAVIAKKESINLNEIIRKPYFIPETKKIDSLLRDFKKMHLHIAVAIDEYGGTSGIICMEDIIEEIVGDIQDEFDQEGEGIISIGEGIWLCDARVNLEDLSKSLNIKFPIDDYDTVGGFILDLFGKIPVKYEKVEWNNFEFIAQEVEGHRVNLIKIIKLVNNDDV